MMSTSSLLDVAPFQYLLFLALFVVNLLLNASGVMSFCINGLIRLMAKEAERGGNNAIRDELLSAAGSHPSGRIVGTLETTLYLYAFVAQIHGLITGVIIFKAFFGWLSVSPDASNSNIHNPRALARYYSYALGNLISLLSAIVLFEVGRYLVKMECLHKMLWI